MAQPKYLTGDGAAIKEFIDKFDVRYFDLTGWLWLTLFRRFCSTVMVRELQLRIEAQN